MRSGLVVRITLGYLLVIGAVMVAAVRSQRALAQAEDTARHLSERSVEGIQLAAELETLMHDRSYVSNYLLSHEERFLAEASSHQAELQLWIQHMEAFARSDAERALTDQIRTQYLSYTALGDTVIRLEQARSPTEARQVFFTMKAQVEGLLQTSQQLLKLAAQDMGARQADASAEMARERRRIFWLTTLGALASLLAGFLLARYVAHPINKLVLRLGGSGGEEEVQFKGDEVGLLEVQVNALLERVRRQERALQQAERLSELGEIAAEIAHETLNPVAGARGMLQVLRRGAVPAERLPEELIAIEAELRRVEDIVRRLLRYARPFEPHLRPVAVEDVVRTAVRSAEATPAAAGHRLLATGATAQQWTLDPELIEQVLVNLLVNALEASPEGGEVELGVHADSTSLTFEVRDHGPGIGKEQRTRLFHPFFTTKPHGNGLGLAVSRNIVQEHGGRIEVDGAPGGGAIFKVFLPPADAPLRT